MAKLSLAKICKQLLLPAPYQDISLTGVSTDSRTIQPNELFVALVGENFDGHNFVEQAVANGAGALLVSRDIESSVPVLKVSDTLKAYGQIANAYRQQFNIPMVGLTGSCGKTTVKNMIAAILQQEGTVLSPPGSYNNEIGVPKTLLQLDQKHDYAVFEMGARNVGDVKYLMQLVQPNIAFINNAAPVHTETFGDVDGVAKVKAEIYEQLDNDGTALLNVDDVYAPYWLSLLPTQKVITFGLEAKADVTCTYIVEEHQQMKFELSTDCGNALITMQVLGMHNVMNALAASACARALNIPLTSIKAGLESFSPSTRRMQLKLGKNGARIIDDTYNANPVAMLRAIDVLRKQNGRKIMVIGDMLEIGNNEIAAHTELGKQIADAKIDKLYAYGDLSRHAAEAFGEVAAFYTDKETLTKELLPDLDKDTVVLVKGSNGMHLEEIIDVIVVK